ncbi:DEAD/DEAH box helicase [Alteromonas pelagimontana]|uniref:ATP-dependent RNA helicase RhlE n=1 Tax=Alteromonas pelagimontana TaxID=1858656 RepID=A0A6M4MFT0_9ALTE|nr:DEAD/DEAH box helicase [Alteromonas pelagimontana]QJR81933.1 DEAD/DEAH box helicase [Alteromonas pelagimontana]
MAFANLGLSAPLLQAISDKGYETPSPIQQQAIPAILSGSDVMAAAQTGTGKTAGFTLPLLELLQKGERPKHNHIRALILTPTRELAAQVEESVKDYSKHLSLSHAVVFGGVGINPQMQRLRKGIDILVATPGRLLDLYQQNAVKFSQLEVLVLDEADRMLDMGFIHDIKRIIKMLPTRRQNLLFSATFSDPIRELANTLVNNPQEISVSPANSTVEKVEQWLVPVDKSRKTAALIKLIKRQKWQQILVFSRTKHGANRIAKKLESAGIAAAAIHGDKSQGARTRALADFKNGKVSALVATDIAARGIDIDQLPFVVNLDLPNVPADYVHRIGRTGRAGASGQAVSFVSEDELDQLKDIERLIKTVIRRETLPGFEPELPLTETVLDTRPVKANRPKKAKAHSTDGAGAKPRNPRQGKPGGNRSQGQGSGKPGEAEKKRRFRSNGANGKPSSNHSS